jgi:hypothetical protein
MKGAIDATLLLSIVMTLFSAAIGLLVWKTQRTISKNEDAAAERDKRRVEREVPLFRGDEAAISAIGELADVIRRCPNCEGADEKLGKANEYAQRVKHEQRDYLTREAARKDG